MIFNTLTMEKKEVAQQLEQYSRFFGMHQELEQYSRFFGMHQELEKDPERLEKQRAELENDYSAQTIRFEQSKKDIAELESKIEQLKIEREKVAKEPSELEIECLKVATIDEELKTIDTKIKELDNIATTLKTVELPTKENQLKEINTSLNDTLILIDKKTLQASDLRKESALLEIKEHKVSQDIKELKRMDLQTREIELKKQLKEIQTSLDPIFVLIGKNQSEAAELENKIQELTRERIEVNQEIAKSHTIEEQLKKIDTSLDSLSLKLYQNKLECLPLDRKRQELEVDCRAINTEIEKLATIYIKERKIKLQTKWCQIDTSSSRISLKLYQNKSELDQLQSTLKHLTTERSTQTISLEQSKKDIAELESKIKQLEIKREKVATERSEYQRKLVTLHTTEQKTIDTKIIHLEEELNWNKKHLKTTENQLKRIDTSLKQIASEVYGTKIQSIKLDNKPNDLEDPTISNLRKKWEQVLEPNQHLNPNENPTTDPNTQWVHFLMGLPHEPTDQQTQN